MVKLPMLRARREREGYSQRDLASRAGVNVGTIVRAEAGLETFPSTARKLARALGCKPAELMGPLDAAVVAAMGGSTAAREAERIAERNRRLRQDRAGAPMAEGAEEGAR